MACTKVFGKVFTALLTGISIHNRDGKLSFSCRSSSSRVIVSVVRLFPFRPSKRKGQIDEISLGLGVSIWQCRYRY